MSRRPAAGLPIPRRCTASTRRSSRNRCSPAGFQWVGESNVLANPKDDHSAQGVRPGDPRRAPTSSSTSSASRSSEARLVALALVAATAGCSTGNGAHRQYRDADTTLARDTATDARRHGPGNRRVRRAEGGRQGDRPDPRRRILDAHLRADRRARAATSTASGPAPYAAGSRDRRPKLYRADPQPRLRQRQREHPAGDRIEGGRAGRSGLHLAELSRLSRQVHGLARPGGVQQAGVRGAQARRHLSDHRPCRCGRIGDARHRHAPPHRSRDRQETGRGGGVRIRRRDRSCSPIRRTTTR